MSPYLVIILWRVVKDTMNQRRKDFPPTIIPVLHFLSLHLSCGAQFDSTWCSTIANKRRRRKEEDDVLFVL